MFRSKYNIDNQNNLPIILQTKNYVLRTCPAMQAQAGYPALRLHSGTVSAIVLPTMTVRMRHTRAHTGNRRSHHALQAPQISTCPNCSAPYMRHRMCPTCGTYRGREVVDMVAKKERSIERAKVKAKSRGLDVHEATEKAKEEATPTKKKSTATKTASKKANK